MALMTYDAQVTFARRWLKQGLLSQSGTWQHGRAWGRMWHGRLGRFNVGFETIGDGPYMRAGSFRVWMTRDTQEGR